MAFCAWLALAMGRAKAKVVDGKPTTTGHSWDGLEEYNNPLPRWWLGLFLLTCAFSLIYLILYPGLGSFQGILGWSQAGQYTREVDRVNKVVEPLFARYLAQDIKTVAADPQAREMGERLYLTYCVQCHGSDARGSRGFPNLTDNDWLYGGEADTIQQTIANGRNGVMPGGLVQGEDVARVANYVLSLSNSGHDPALAALGKSTFAVCASCHGADGKGNPALGAPNLTDKIWLHGGGIAAITESITKGRSSTMPAFGELLGEGKVHVLAAYIWGLSNQPGEQAAR
ncbi:MAG: cytochrome-c oxidase, cbb3-type subunit III [Gammaproteobacteria bacterium]